MVKRAKIRFTRWFFAELFSETSGRLVTKRVPCCRRSFSRPLNAKIAFLIDGEKQINNGAPVPAGILISSSFQYEKCI